jgi:hypothetical protein
VIGPTSAGAAPAGFRSADPGYGWGMAMTARTVVQKYLMGDYPATRGDLVDRALREGADPAVLGLLRNLQDERFESAVAVEQALGHER